MYCPLVSGVKYANIHSRVKVRLHSPGEHLPDYIFSRGNGHLLPVVKCDFLGCYLFAGQSCHLPRDVSICILNPRTRNCQRFYLSSVLWGCYMDNCQGIYSICRTSELTNHKFFGSICIRSVCYLRHNCYLNISKVFPSNILWDILPLTDVILVDKLFFHYWLSPSV